MVLQIRFVISFWICLFYQDIIHLKREYLLIPNAHISTYLILFFLKTMGFKRNIHSKHLLFRNQLKIHEIEMNLHFILSFLLLYL